MNGPPSTVQAASIGLAFAVGGLTTYFDCFQTMTIRVGRVPETFRTNPAVLALSILCGSVAAVACFLSISYPESALSTVLTLRADDPWRGFVVGASVLVLIRSKLFNIENSPFGGDYLYDLGRNGVIDNANRRYTIFRSRFLNRNEAAALAAGLTFEPALLSLFAAALAARPMTVQTLFNGRLATITGNRPAAAFNPTDIVWVTYYRAMIGVALDACGPTVLLTLNGFR